MGGLDRYYRIIPAFICLLMSGVAILVAQPTDPAAYRETLKERSMEREMEAGGINDPFVGITTNGMPDSGHYSVRSTGISTVPIVDAALAFLDTLDDGQKDELMFPVDDIEWRKWANQANYYRDGLWFEQMSEKQRDAAFNLMAASLSAKGLQLTKDAMKLNRTLGELNNNDFAKYGEWKYWLSIMGEPSTTEPWGWQLDGHHLIINYVVIGDQVVMTPTFWGAEPTVAHAGKYKGTEILTDETVAGLKLIQSLTADQKEKAIISKEKDGVNILTQAFSDNAIVPYAGISVSEFTQSQKEILRNVIGLWVGNMRDEHARVRMKEVESYLGDTWFAWIGETGDDAVFYYRIQNPVILIEFDHQRPQGLVNLYDHRDAYREHIHAVIRSPNGNDYGKDLLRQHYERHAHGTQDENGVAHWHTTQTAAGL